MSTDDGLHSFELKELAEILIKHQGLHEGLYDLGFELNVGFGNVGPSREQALPGAVFGIKAVGLSRVSEPGPHTLDAAVVNPAAALKRRRRVSSQSSKGS